jgi:SNF2 family DNA or RNA helicase
MTIHISEKHAVVCVPYDPRFPTLFPDTKTVVLKGQKHAVFHHGPEETRVLRNLGLDVPAPILIHYKWTGKHVPFEVQKNTAALCSASPRAYVLNGLGTGKTKSVLWAYDYLRTQGVAKKLLVVAPLSTLTVVWAKEIFETTPHLRYNILHGTREKRLERLAEDVDIYVTNHDGLAVLQDELMARDDIDTLVIDELATFRNARAGRSRILKKLTTRMRWAWGLTGSPTPREPTDAWGQAWIMTPNTVPKYFTRFQDLVMRKITQFKYVPKDGATYIVHNALQPAVRYTLDDVQELPDCVERTIDVELTDRQLKIYTKMEQVSAVAVENHTITGANAGAVLQKLLQISCGWVYNASHEAIPLDPKPRIQALLDLISGADHKVIVFVPFKHALAGIGEVLTREKIDHALVSGDTPPVKRNNIFQLFQSTDKIKVLAAHPKCMSHGLTLTAADTIVWFAPTHDLEIFEQANGRIRRIGQKHKQQIIMMQGTRVEKAAYARLRTKAKVQNLILELFTK